MRMSKFRFRSTPSGFDILHHRFRVRRAGQRGKARLEARLSIRSERLSPKRDVSLLRERKSYQYYVRRIGRKLCLLFG